MFNFGIIGTGFIAGRMLKANSVINDSDVIAVLDISKETALDFCKKNNKEMDVYTSTEEFLQRDDMDGVYISTPNNFHYDYIIQSLNAGKHVYCEKPITLTHSELEKCLALAKEKNLLLVEGLWTRFLPIIQEVKKRLANNDIGELRYIQGDFCFNTKVDLESRLYNKKLGGGAIYDLGSYVLGTSELFAGKHLSCASHSTKIKDGVDVSTMLTLYYKENIRSQLHVAIDCNVPNDMVIYGTNGSITIHGFWHATSYTISVNNQESETITMPFDENGYENIFRAFVKGASNNSLELTEYNQDSMLYVSKTIEEVINNAVVLNK